VSVEILVYAASIIIIIWGLVQLYPTKSRSKVIGELSGDNNKIVSMEWIAEGITFILIGILVITVTYIAGAEKVGSRIVYLSSGVMLLILTLWSLSKMSSRWTKTMKACLVIKSTVGLIYFVSVVV
jgi:hypothetical protein